MTRVAAVEHSSTGPREVPALEASVAVKQVLLGMLSPEVIAPTICSVPEALELEVTVYVVLLSVADPDPVLSRLMVSVPGLPEVVILLVDEMVIVRLCEAIE